MKAGILFDLDGTLWDACEAMTVSWNRECARQGYDFCITVEQMRGCMGKILPEIGRVLFPGIEAAAQLKLVEDCCRAEEALLKNQGGTLFCGVEKTLAQLAAHYPLFIVSNCQSGYIETFLAHPQVPLAHLFKDHTCHGDTGKSKGENIAMMIKKHGLEKALYIGDTQSDYQSAAAAHCPFVHAAWGFGTVPPGTPALAEFTQLEAYAKEVLDQL